MFTVILYVWKFLFVIHIGDLQTMGIFLYLCHKGEQRKFEIGKQMLKSKETGALWYPGTEKQRGN